MNPEFKDWLANQTYYIVYDSFALKYWLSDVLWPHKIEFNPKKWTWDEVKEYYE